MNCEKIQELILTDYLDGEIDKRQEEFIKQHLATCIGCQEFLSIAQKTVVEPFLNAGKVTPDEFLWYKIKGKIETEKQRQSNLAARFGVMMRERYRILIPALVMTLVVVVVIWTDIITFKQSSLYKTGTRDLSPEVYMVINNYLEDESVEYVLMQNVNFQTDIEEYFL